MVAFPSSKTPPERQPRPTAGDAAAYITEMAAELALIAERSGLEATAAVLRAAREEALAAAKRLGGAGEGS